MIFPDPFFLIPNNKNRALPITGSTLYNPKKPNENFFM